MKRFFLLFVVVVLAYFSSFSQVACGERHTFIVLINTYNQLFVESEIMDIKDLKDAVKEFIDNPNDKEVNAEKYEREIPYLGKVMVSKGIISLQCDRGTSYEKYIAVQNELERAFNELRNELALEKFKVSYKQLPREKQWAINRAVPKNISEAEPRWIRNEKWELVRNNRRWSGCCY